MNVYLHRRNGDLHRKHHRPVLSTRIRKIAADSDRIPEYRDAPFLLTLYDLARADSKTNTRRSLIIWPILCLFCIAAIVIQGNVEMNQALNEMVENAVNQSTLPFRMLLDWIMSL